MSERSSSSTLDDVRRLLAEFAMMVRFYSRLPLPRLCADDDPLAPPPFARALRMLPYSALAIVLPQAATLAALATSELSSLVVAVIGLIVGTIATGAFHEDGIADISDAFAGGATPERRLEIMKDSRVGAFGGVALAAQFVLRAALVADLLDRFDGWPTALLVLGVAAPARLAPLVLMKILTPARPDGLGRAVGRPQTGALIVGGIGAMLLYDSAGFFVVGLGPTLAGLAIGAIGLVGLALLARDKIGGYTGDVIGSGTVICEIAALIGLSS